MFSVLTLLAVDGNPLKTISIDTLMFLNNTLKGLSLGGRYLVCDCKLRWIAEWIRKGDLQVFFFSKCIFEGNVLLIFIFRWHRENGTLSFVDILNIFRIKVSTLSNRNHSYAKMRKWKLLRQLPLQRRDQQQRRRFLQQQLDKFWIQLSWRLLPRLWRSRRRFLQWWVGLKLFLCY